MPNTKSAKKALRQNKTRKKRNIVIKKNSKGLLKEVNSLIAKKEPQKAKELISKVYKALDKSAKSGIIKKGTADRKKSRITKMIQREEKLNSSNK